MAKAQGLYQDSKIFALRDSSAACALLVALLSAPDPDHHKSLKPLLMRLAARYLLREKRRGAALCSVANFHLSNGAMVMRMVWGGDTSQVAAEESFGIMVNYQYEWLKVHDRIREYVTHKTIAVSVDEFGVRV